MNNIADNQWHCMSDGRILKLIGEFVRHHRMEQGKTQRNLAGDAGISRTTLSHLERGETVTIATLIQVLRVLDKLDVLNTFQITTPLSPLQLVEAEKKRRQRISSPRKKTKNNTNENEDC